jgi:L-2-hydroxyglutarate oxidase LhgO
VDSHELMRHFEATAVINGATVLYNSELSGIKHTEDGYILTLGDNPGNVYEVLSKIVINASGLYSGKVAEMAGIDADKAGYRINYHKGVYFRAGRQLDKYPEVLIYPVPPESGSVGIHTTPDLYGGMRLGPHFFWADSIDYSVDDSLHKFFYESVKKYLPFLEFDDIAPDSSGIMSTIRRDGEPIKDFVIQNESGRGLSGLINLIGIDSPGLTASPAIAEYVGTMVKELSLV